MSERTVPAIERGLTAATRSWNDIEVTVEVIVGAGRTDEELEKAARIRGLVAFYASTPGYKAVLDVHGWGDLQPELKRLSKQGDWGSMSSLISDDVLRTLAVHGTPSECAAEIARRYGRWADRVCVYFPGYHMTDDLLTELVEAIHQYSRVERRSRFAEHDSESEAVE
jgi:alkanesulfonate monooxygenase SsuD/methylene tetrahydromethanopterin reductase-like flavin-dependent oxidoreductase (luciferase family)